jgi:hypothetical protein
MAGMLGNPNIVMDVIRALERIPPLGVASQLDAF